MNTAHSHTGLFLFLSAIVILFLFALAMIFLEKRNNKLKQQARELIPSMLKYGWIDARELRQRLHNRGVKIGGTTFYFLMAEFVGEGTAECQKKSRMATQDFFEDVEWDNETEADIVSEEIWVRRYRLKKAI